MIMKFLQKVPAGLMLVPLLIGAVIHTLFPQALEIGGLTTAAFSNAGAATCMGLQLFCLGTTLQLKDMPAVLKRGGTLLLSKFLIGQFLESLWEKYLDRLDSGDLRHYQLLPELRTVMVLYIYLL